jgi:hypothetical protein
VNDSPTEDPHTAYYDAVSQADADLGEAISCIVAEQDAGRITAEQAAAERCEVLTRHLGLLKQLRAEHLGEA